MQVNTKTGNNLVHIFVVLKILLIDVKHLIRAHSVEVWTSLLLCPFQKEEENNERMPAFACKLRTELFWSKDILYSILVLKYLYKLITSWVFIVYALNSTKVSSLVRSVIVWRWLLSLSLYIYICKTNIFVYTNATDGQIYVTKCVYIFSCVLTYECTLLYIHIVLCTFIHM